MVSGLLRAEEGLASRAGSLGLVTQVPWPESGGLGPVHWVRCPESSGLGPVLQGPRVPSRGAGALAPRLQWVVRRKLEAWDGPVQLAVMVSRYGGFSPERFTPPHTEHWMRAATNKSARLSGREDDIWSDEMLQAMV